MSIFNDKSLKGVADAVSKIMEASKKEENKFHNKLDKLVHGTFGDSPDEKKMKKEEKELSPKQKAIAKLDHPKHKIDAGDLAKLRAGHKPVKEEVEQLDELSKSTLGSYIKKASGSVEKHSRGEAQAFQDPIGDKTHGQKVWLSKYHQSKLDKRRTGIEKATDRLTKEEKESCEDEAEEAVEKHEKKMHGKKGEVAKHEKEMHKESFTSLIESYKKEGLKSLSKMKKEEVDNETYEKEMKDQKDKFDGKKKGGDVAKASVQAVKQEEVELDEDSYEDYLKKYSDSKEVKRKGRELMTRNEFIANQKHREYWKSLDKKDGVAVYKPIKEEVVSEGDVRPDDEDETEELDEADTYSIQNAKTKQTYHLSKYPITQNSEKYKKIKAAGGDHAHATIYKNGKPVTEESELDEAEKMKGEDPCWKDYEMIGHKMKNGKKVPNCVPKNEEVEVELEERTLTEPETKKKEEIVKSMKKKMAGFKERYGERAKSVAYSTATKIAKEKA